MKGLNVLTSQEVLLYTNDSEVVIQSKQGLDSRITATEKFWAIQIGEHKKLLDIQQKPLENYVDEDILKVIGYTKRKPNSDSISSEKTSSNDYFKTRRHIYSEQVHFPKEEFLIMQNYDIYTMIKKRPIDDLFAILYIGQASNDYMTEEIRSFMDDHGSSETCCMLLHIICNPQDTYLISTDGSNYNKGNEHKSKRLTYSPLSKFEEQKGANSDEEEKESKKKSEGCKFRTASENIINFAKSVYFKIGNFLPKTSTTKDYSFLLDNERPTLLNDRKMNENVVETIKLASLKIYLSRLLQPVYKNFIVYVTSLTKKAEYYPNMGIAEKRVIGSKLSNLLGFMKTEGASLNKFPRDKRETNDATRGSKYADMSLNYENMMQQEAAQIEYLKIFITRCIIAVDFLEEAAKSVDDFAVAVERMSSETRKDLLAYTFRNLTQEISHEIPFKTFIKKLLEVKTEA